MKIVFGLLTDFGFDFAVASIKGVLLRSIADAHIVDVDHSIEKFNILNAAFVIDKVYRFFPNDTIFICVVDPGVGTERDLLCVEIDSYCFIGPNNGIFHFLFNKKNKKISKVKQQEFTPESVTFHGRDVFAPAAIKIAQGDRSILTSIDSDEIIQLTDLGDQINDGVITYIDSFGNIKTNILVGEQVSTKAFVNILINNKPYTAKFTNTFTDAQPGELICYKGSNATLEIAVNLGSARERLGAYIGAKISFDQ